MGTGGARRQLSLIAGGPAENGGDGVHDGGDGVHDGAAAGGGYMSDSASAAAKKAGAGDRHGATTAARDRFAFQQENPAGNPYRVVGK